MLKVLQLDDVLAEIESYKTFMQNLTKLTGKEIISPYDMYNLHMGLTAQAFMNLTLPEWTNDMFPNGRLKDAIEFYYRLVSYNEKLRRLNGGALLKNFLDNINAAKKGLFFSILHRLDSKHLENGCNI